MIKEILISAFLIVGTFFSLVGSIGMVRLPDLYTRMHALTKSVTLGLASLLLGSLVALWSWEAGIKVVLAIAFHFLTNPVGAHMISRAAYFHLNVPFWNNTIVDEWKDKE